MTTNLHQSSTTTVEERKTFVFHAFYSMTDAACNGTLHQETLLRYFTIANPALRDPAGCSCRSNLILQPRHERVLVLPSHWHKMGAFLHEFEKNRAVGDIPLC